MSVSMGAYQPKVAEGVLKTRLTNPMSAGSRNCGG